jgi:hypothetical protein
MVSAFSKRDVRRRMAFDPFKAVVPSDNLIGKEHAMADMPTSPQMKIWSAIFSHLRPRAGRPAKRMDR